MAPSLSVQVHGPLPSQTKGQQYYTYTVTHDANGLDITWRGQTKSILAPSRPLSDSLDSSCMNGPQTLRVVATSSCGAQSASEQSVAPLDTTPVITLRAIPYTNPVYTQFQIGFFFPQSGGGRVSGHFLPASGGVRHFLNEGTPQEGGRSYSAQEGGVVIVEGTSCINQTTTKTAEGGTGGSCSIKPAACNECVGTPVHTTSGNMRYEDADPVGGFDVLPFVRNYDSQSAYQGRFGHRWSSIFDASLTKYDGISGYELVNIRTEAGDQYVYKGTAGTYEQIVPARGRAAREGTLKRETSGAWIHTEPDGRMARVFSPAGVPTAYRDAITGREVLLTWQGTAPAAVADSWGAWSYAIALDASNRIRTIALDGDPAQTWTYEYLAHMLHRVVSPAGLWRRYEYMFVPVTGTFRPLSQIYDGLGNLIESHEYHDNGTVTSVQAEDDIDLIAMGGAGRNAGETITSVTYKTGRVERHYKRYVAGEWRTVEIDGGCTSCGARTTATAYDDAGNLIRTQDAEGYVTTHAHDALGRVTSTAAALRPAGCDPATASDHCRQTADTLPAVPLEPTSATVTAVYEYNDGNWPYFATTVRTASVLNASEPRTTTFTYDGPTGQTLSTSVTGWTGIPARVQTRTTTTVLYSAGDAAAFDPGGGFALSWTTLPQPKGMRRSSDGPRTDVADTTTFVYYPVHSSVPGVLRGRLAAVRNAAGQITRYESYDLYGNPDRVVDVNGVAQSSTHDVLGGRTSSTTEPIAGCDSSADPLCATPLTASFTYAGAGPLVISTNAGGGVTQYEYDSRRRTKSVSRGPGAADLRERITYEYDPSTGRKAREGVAAREGSQWVEKRSASHAYDSFGRLIEDRHPGGAKVVYGYGAGNHVESVQDENHTQPNTSYAYDPSGRIEEVRQTLAGGAVITRYAYNVNGGLTSVTDPNGNVTSYVYDDFGQLIRQESPVTGITLYEYDAAGNLTSTTDANGAVTTRTYDAMGRTLTSASAKPNAASETTTWTYDDPAPGQFGIGRMTAMTDPVGTVAYAYTRSGQLRAETRTFDPGTGPATTAFTYDADGNRASIRYPSGTLASYTYDFAGRPRSVAAGAQPVVADAAYAPFGPLTRLTLGNGTTQSMEYDARYRLQTNRIAGPGGVLAGHRYSYDAKGNITAIADELDAAYNRTFVYDDLDRLTTANTGTALWGSGSFAYDAMGNMLSSALGNTARNFIYDGTTPKIATVTENGVTSAVSYDAAGNEVAYGAASSDYSPRNHLLGAGTKTFAYDGRGVPVISRSVTTLASLSVTPVTLTGGEPASGVVTLSGVASTDTVVSFSSTAGATVPASVTIASGSASAVFAIETAVVAQQRAVEITATFGSATQRVSLTVLPSELEELSLSPAAVTGGATAIAKLQLSGPVPDGGAVVSLSSDGGWITMPSTVELTAGASTATFDVLTSAVSTETVVTVRAKYREVTLQATLTIRPPALLDLAVTPASVVGGAPVTAEATLNTPAGGSGETIAIESTNTTAVPAPAPIVIAAGSTTGQTAIATNPVAATTPVVVSATHNGVTRTAPLTVLPPPVTLDRVTLTPASIVGSNDAVGTIVLTAPAPAGAIDVDLMSGDAAIAVVPPGVTIAAGATEASFPISTRVVAAAADVTITAIHAATVRTAVLNVLPPLGNHVTALGVTPAFVTGGTTVTGTLQLALAASEKGGADVVLTSSSTAATVPRTVTVKKNRTSATFEIKTSSVTAPAIVTLTASYGDVIQRTDLTVLPPNTITLASMTLQPASVVGGNISTATVALTGAAPAGGAVVKLTGTRRNIVSLPPTVTVAAGASMASFVVSTDVVHGKHPRGAKIAAAYNGISRTATLTVLPPPSQASQAQPAALCASMSVAPCVTRVAAEPLALAASISASATLSFYTPEMQLLAQSAGGAGHDYIWFAGVPVAQIETPSQTVRYYATDHLGTPYVMTDSGGIVVWRAELTPYGEVHQFRTGANLPQPLRFPGQVAEASLELSANVFRWYRAGWGRYTQRDPIGLRGGLNLYTYVSGRPTVAVDPLGLKKVCCTEGPAKLTAAADKAAQKAQQLVEKGYFEVSAGAEAIASTYCMSADEGKGAAEVVFHPPYKKLGPCQQACTQVHEGVHAKVCKEFGPLVLAADGIGELDEALAYRQRLCAC